jgi:recombination DNA repair RAD52 pathway protein
MNREILEKPFGPEQIKQREGNFGKMLDYIEGHAVIQRLNDAFDARLVFYPYSPRDPEGDR